MTVKTHVVGIVVLVLGFVQARAQGYIVPNGVIFNGFDGIGYSVSVIQNPATGDYTGFDLNPVGKTPPSSPYVNTYLFNPVVDEGVRTFIVSANDPISLPPIAAGNYTELTYPNSYVFANGATFYLGFYTGYNPWDSHGNYTGIYSDPVFGWGRFRNNTGVIEMLSSALEYGGGGIVAGTQTIIPIPEPGSLTLFGLGAAFFGLRRTRCRRTSD